MNRDSKTSNIINPYAHPDGMNLFLAHFNLTSKNPDLVYLQLIVEKFANIPYENISKIIRLSECWDEGQKIRLPEQVIEEHISKQLGGTCFSLTFSLQSILVQNRFTCYPVMADMRAGPNIHCALIIILNNIKYLVDPGYLLNQPVAIEPLTRRIYHREFGGVELRHDQASGGFNLYTFENDDLKWRYRFYDRPCPPQEFLQHWQASFTKPMMRGFCLTKVTKSGLIYIHKNYICQTTGSGKTSGKIKKNYHATIQSIFGIEKEVVECAQAALATNRAKEIELGLFIPKPDKPEIKR